MKEHHKTCMVCKKSYIAKRADGMYCGGACKEQAFLQRRGKKPKNRAVLLEENKLMKMAIKIYIDMESRLKLSLPDEMKRLIEGVNCEARKLL